MPCIFCIAVFLTMAGAIAGAVVDEIEEKLRGAGRDVQRNADTESVARFDLKAQSNGRDVPVAVTVYKEHGRVRIQILTHDISREDAEKLENELAEALGLEIVDRSDERTEEKVREAVGGGRGEPKAEAEKDDADKDDAEKVPATTDAPEPPAREQR